MLKAFFDDSGSDAESSFYVLGGYLSTVNRWEAFSDEWAKVLAAHPRIKYFKMRAAESRRDEFWGWTETARNAKLDDLAVVITRNVQCEISCILDRKLHDLLATDLETPKEFLDPYLTCYITLMSILSGFRDPIGIPAGQKVDVVFDEQGAVQGIVVPFHAEVRKLPRLGDVIGGTEFQNDKEVLPLQAADFIAWLLRRYSATRQARPALMNVISVPNIRIQPTLEMLQLRVAAFVNSRSTSPTPNSSCRTHRDC